MAKTTAKKRQPKRTPKKGAPKPPVKQPDLSWHDAFIAAFEMYANVRAACESSGVARRVAYEHYEAYPEFKVRWDTAKENALDSLEDAARKRALNSSDTLLIFLLKSHRPEVYRETIRNEHIDVSKLSDEELQRIARG